MEEETYVYAKKLETGGVDGGGWLAPGGMRTDAY
jgi:hypothetical protein